MHPSLLAGDAVVAAAAACVTVYTWPAIVTVPVRGAVPALAATLSDTLPLPLPDAPAVTVIHAALLSADHPHEVPAVTPTVNVPPADPADWLAGEMLKLQPAPACVTTSACPRRPVIFPVRVPPVFARTLYATQPLPVPAPERTCSHVGESLAEVHLHPGSAAIATLDVPPATVAEVDERPRANLHDPDCVTVKIFPPAVIEALRVAPPLFELVE